MDTIFHPIDNCLVFQFFHPTPTMDQLPPIEFHSSFWLNFQQFMLNKSKFNMPKDALVVHIRSGDIFTRKGAQKEYAQPPCNYYFDVIKNWSSVISIAEDTKNPCVNLLNRKLKTFKKTNIEKKIFYTFVKYSKSCSVSRYIW